MATETLTGVPQELYPNAPHGVQGGVTTLGHDELRPGRVSEVYRHFVHEVPVARAPGTVQGTSAALIALFAGATVLLVEEPGQHQPMAQLFTPEHESAGSVGQLLEPPQRTFALRAAEREESRPLRGVFAPSFEKRVLSTKQVRLDDVRPRARSPLTIIGGREYDEDE